MPPAPESSHQILIAPSLLAADGARLGEETTAVEAAGADWLHLDIMDGHFVPNLSFGPALLRAVRPYCALPFDVHLMIAPVDPFIPVFAESGADHILVQAESGPHLHRSLSLVRALGKKAGVALNPATPVSALTHVLDLVDIILIMTVNPGFSGQDFLPAMLPKIAETRALIETSGRAILLEVDGGITPHTARLAREAGAGALVAGAAIFGQTDYRAAIMALRG